MGDAADFDQGGVEGGAAADVGEALGGERVDVGAAAGEIAAQLGPIEAGGDDTEPTLSLGLDAKDDAAAGVEDFDGIVASLE